MIIILRLMIIAVTVYGGTSVRAQPQRAAMHCSGAGAPYTVIVNSTGDLSKGVSIVAVDNSTEIATLTDLTLVGNTYYAKIYTVDAALDLTFDYNTPEHSHVSYEGVPIATCTTEK